MHSFFCEIPGAPGTVAELGKRERDHLFKTLRAAPGETVELLDGRGGRALAEVRPGRTLEVIKVERVAPPERRLVLCCAVPRRSRFDVLLKQAAELGVWSIRLVQCERSVAQPEGSDRWQLLLQEGCKQSKNPFLPEIVPSAPLADVLAGLRGEGAGICYGAVSPVAAPVRPVRGDLAWMVGPEGGFTAAEEEAMVRAGAIGLNLGPWVLRLETAAVCGLAVLRQWMMS